MTKQDIDSLHEIHPLHERYIRMADDLPPMEVLQSSRVPFAEADQKLMLQLGERTYAADKWTVRQILQHLIDTERILSYRALCIARHEQAELPGFDEAAYGQYANGGSRAIDDLMQEFDIVRQGTLLLFQSFDEQMLQRVGTAAGKRVSVLALAYIISGHPLYHLQLIRERYFPLLHQDIAIVVNAPEYLEAFKNLNKAWIEKDFELEPADLYLLDNPQEAILDKGGAIVYAVENGKAIGTAALQPVEDGEWKLIKMTVDEAHRGRGIGELLTRAVLREARKMGINRLILFSNTEFNAPAIRLYRRMGFYEIPLTNVKFKRANIKMEINL